MQADTRGHRYGKFGFTVYTVPYANTYKEKTFRHADANDAWLLEDYVDRMFEEVRRRLSVCLCVSVRSMV